VRSAGAIATLNTLLGVMANNFLFDGAKFDFHKILSPNFQVSHSFAMPQGAPSSYTFGSFYADQHVRLCL
jgi:hypothetical protein